MKYSKIYYDEGYVENVIETFNKEAEEKNITIEDFKVMSGNYNKIKLFALYTVNEDKRKVE